MSPITHQSISILYKEDPIIPFDALLSFTAVASTPTLDHNMKYFMFGIY